MGAEQHRHNSGSPEPSRKLGIRGAEDKVEQNVDDETENILYTYKMLAIALIEKARQFIPNKESLAELKQKTDELMKRLGIK